MMSCVENGRDEKKCILSSMIYCCLKETWVKYLIKIQKRNAHIQNANQFLDHLSSNLGIIIYRSSTNLFVLLLRLQLPIFVILHCLVFLIFLIAVNCFVFYRCWKAFLFRMFQIVPSDKFATFDYYDL